MKVWIVFTRSREAWPTVVGVFSSEEIVKYLVNGATQDTWIMPVELDHLLDESWGVEDEPRRA